jgi:PAS domain S-box-containing protein
LAKPAIDPDEDRILEANRQVACMLGYEPDELVRAVRISSVHPHEMERLRQFAHAVQTTGEGWTNGPSCTREDGQRLPWTFSLQPDPATGTVARLPM